MPPESSSGLVVLNLALRGEQLVAQVDRVDPDVHESSLSVLWNADECPPGFVPIGDGVVFVHIPNRGYVRRQYGARPTALGLGEWCWPDRIVGVEGLMIVLVLPPGWAVPSVQQARPLFQLTKVTDDGRLALSWVFRTAGSGPDLIRSVRVKWRMEPLSTEQLHAHSAILNGEADRLATNVGRDGNPLVGGPTEQAEMARLAEYPSVVAPVEHRPPPWQQPDVRRDALRVILPIILLGFGLGGFYTLAWQQAVLWLIFLIAAFPLGLAFAQGEALSAGNLVEMYRIGLAQLPVIGQLLTRLGGGMPASQSQVSNKPKRAGPANRQAR